MKRYQLHLNPTSVQLVDDLADLYDFSRSELIRELLEKISRQYFSMVNVLANTKMLKAPISKTWLEMCGAGKTSARDVSLNVDEIYLKDRPNE